MSTVKTLKSVNLSSVTIIGTAIHVILTIIGSIVALILIGTAIPSGIGVVGALIPAVVLASFAYSVYTLFTESYLYNWLAKRFNTISFEFEDQNTILKISPVPASLIIAIISTIMAIIASIIAMIILPFMLSSAVQTLMMTGQSEIAVTLYQLIMIVSNPVFIAIFIVATFIGTFIYTLIGTYIFNLLTTRIPLKLELNKVDGITTVEKLDIKSFSFIFAVIGLILGLVSGFTNGISDGNFVNIIIPAVLGFISGFVVTAIGTFLYNVLAPKLGKVECELIDE